MRWYLVSYMNHELCMWILVLFGLDNVQSQNYNTMETYFGLISWLGSDTNVKLSSLGIQPGFPLEGGFLRTELADEESRWSHLALWNRYLKFWMLKPIIFSIHSFNILACLYALSAKIIFIKVVSFYSSEKKNRVIKSKKRQQFRGIVVSVSGTFLTSLCIESHFLVDLFKCILVSQK